MTPDHANARFNLATILEARGMLDEAIGHYEAAARIAPDPGKLEALAAAYAAAGRFDDAVEALESALALAPAGERTDRLRRGLEQYRRRRERGGS